MLNELILVGRLGDKPEIKFFESGRAKATASLATTRPNKEKTTDWHRVEIWGDTAEKLVEMANKGDVIAFTGSLEYNSYETAEGQKRKDAIMAARTWRFCGGKKDGQDGQEGRGNGGEVIQSNDIRRNPPAADSEEIPF